ncbi:MAG: energy transducer TonB [Steroidobacteraceae bacterium]
MRTRQIRGLIALTNDPALIRALQDLATVGIDVSVVQDLHDLTDELLQHTDAAALVDAAALDAPVDGMVDALTHQLPDLCLMVAGHGAEQLLLASRIANQSVFRFVHKPASTQRLKLFMDAAARSPERTGSIAILATGSSSKDFPARIETAMRGKSPRMLASIGLAVVVASAAAVWAFWPAGKSADRNVAPQVTTTAPVTARPGVAALVKQANLALAAGKYVASDGTGAAELFRVALKLDANNRAASEGYGRAIDQALHRAEESLLAGRLNEASSIAAAVDLIEPRNPRLGFLNSQITREVARVSTDDSQRQAFEAIQVKIRAALASMKDKLKQGALIDPAAGSAVASFREAEAIGANDPTVRSARETLIATLLTAADAELSSRRPPSAKRLVDTARSINSNAPGIDVLYRRVEEVTAQLDAPAPVKAARIEERLPPPAPAPVEDVAAPAASPPASSAGNEVVAASKLRLLRSQTPTYPDRALQQLVSGWVEMEFTVATDGSVKQIAVTNSEPRKTFDVAATNALARYRFAPVLKDGTPVTVRARLTMRFAAQDAK